MAPLSPIYINNPRPSYNLVWTKSFLDILARNSKPYQYTNPKYNALLKQWKSNEKKFYEIWSILMLLPPAWTRVLVIGAWRFTDIIFSR